MVQGKVFERENGKLTSLQASFLQGAWNGRSLFPHVATGNAKPESVFVMYELQAEIIEGHGTQVLTASTGRVQGHAFQGTTRDARVTLQKKIRLKFQQLFFLILKCLDKWSVRIGLVGN